MRITKKILVPFEQMSYLAQVKRLRELASLALKFYALKGATLEFISHGENATFKVTSKHNEKFLLRIHRKDYHSQPALLEELRWLELLSLQGLNVPKPVNNQFGNCLTKVFHPAIGERSCDLFYWIEGRFLSKSISESDMLDIGALLAKIQSHGRKLNGRYRKYWTSEGLVGVDPKFGSIDQLNILRKDEQRKLTKIRKTLLSKLKIYEKRFPKKMGMIHADLHFGNLLKTKSGAIAAIDFDDSGHGFYIYDLVIPLIGLEHHLKLHKRFHSYRPLKKALLKGYSSIAELNAYDLDLLQDLIIARKLLMIGWLHSRSDNPKLQKRLSKYTKQTLKYITNPYL